MKKVFTLALATLLLVACDSDDNSDGSTINISENGLLVKKITQISDDGDYGSSLIEEFSYEGNKLVEKIKTTGYSTATNSTKYVYRTEYIYSSDLISKTREYYVYDTEESLSNTTLYFYDTDNRVIRVDYGSYSETYSYGSNGTVTSIDDDCTVEIVFNGGNPTSSSEDCGVEGRLMAISYDNKPSIFSSVTGFNWLFDNLTESDYVGFSNNVTRVTFDYGADEGTEVVNFTYDYNDAGYPRNLIVKSSGLDEDESTIVIEYYQ
jgi:hypothetical protein